MTAEELTETINALFERLEDDDANVFVHEGDMPFGVRGEKKRVKGCYLSKDAEGEQCIVIEAEPKKPQVAPENRSCLRSCENCTRAHVCKEYNFDSPKQEAACCPLFTPIQKGDKQ